MIDIGQDFERMRDYAVGRMSDDEQRAFEDRLVRDPALVRELDRSLQLRDGLRQLQSQGYFARSAPKGAGARRRQPRINAWLPALAAAAVAALALVLWVEPRSSASPLLVASTASPVGARFSFIAMRGGTMPNLRLPSSGSIDFQVQPAAHATVPLFRVTLSRQGTGVTIGALSALKVDARGYVHAYADSGRLGAGTYRLEVEPDAGAQGPRESFEFRLQSAGAAAR